MILIVFLLFKVDDAQNSHCGNDGELLYDSKKYPKHRSQSFKDAHEAGFDPIGALMDACKPYGIKFHAWFPVFKDPFAVAYAEKKGVYGSVEAVGPKDASGFYPKPFDSKTFANPAVAAVVEYELSLLAELGII